MTALHLPHCSGATSLLAILIEILRQGFSPKARGICLSCLPQLLVASSWLVNAIVGLDDGGIASGAFSGVMTAMFLWS